MAADALRWFQTLPAEQQNQSVVMSAAADLHVALADWKALSAARPEGPAPMTATLLISLVLPLVSWLLSLAPGGARSPAAGEPIPYRWRTAMGQY